MVFLSDTHGPLKLYFLRHAIASPRGDPKYKDDSIRPLTSRGRKKMQRAAAGMKNSGLKFDLILSSPYLRAKQTAEIVRQTWGPVKKEKIHLTNLLCTDAAIDEVLQEIHAHFPRSKNVLLVGHEPHLTAMVSSLLKSEKSLLINFKKGGLCSLSLGRSRTRRVAVLNWFLTPSQLALMGA